METAILDISSRPWHSPAYVLFCFDKILEIFKEKISIHRDFKKAREARAAAILLLGINKLQKIHYMMQIVEDESPDILSIRLVESKNRPIIGEIQGIEILSYGSYSQGEVTDFIINKKLSPSVSKKAYDDKTIILCEVKKKVKLLPYLKMYKKLKKINPISTVFIFGKVSPVKHIYQICQIWPKVDYLVDVDLVNLVKKYPQPHNLMITRSSEKKINYISSEAQKPTPFEVFGLDKRLLIRRFHTENKKDE